MGIKRKLKHLHSGHSGIMEKLADLRSGITKVLCDKLYTAEGLCKPANQIHAGAFDPASVSCGVLSVGNCPIAFKATEMVYPDHIIELGIAIYPVYPPAEAILPHSFIIVQRISPKLSVSAEIIRRNACNFNRNVPLVQLKVLWACPNIGGIKCYIYGNVSDKLNTILMRIFFKLVPLLKE